jgi:phosphoenolpyruvate-protein kinase (PTS system EI component)
MADRFAPHVDFFSVGTNDLTQYTFAADRTNPHVAGLADACHPAVFRQVRAVITAAHACGKWVGVCGELAGDPDAIPVLLGLGLGEFSIAPHWIPRAKALIRSMSFRDAQGLAEAVLDLDGGEQVRRAVREWNLSSST